MSDLKYLLKDFKVPSGIVFEKDEVKEDYGKFRAKPFEKGFATTVGNSLRRTLLSSIPGVAITAVKIDGVTQEFSGIPGVIEDVTDILINLKRVRLKLNEEINKKVVHVEIKGKKEFKAGDLEVDSDIKILNPDLYIASLNDNAKISMDFEVDRGRGYVPSEEIKVSINDVNVIPLDAIFSPVVKVKFSIENVRVGQKTDYEQLILEVWTDKSITPDNAVAQAAKILKDIFSLFLNFDDKDESIFNNFDEEEGEDENKELLEKVLSMPVERLELSVRAGNCLDTAKIKTIGELIRKTESDMLRTKNFGKKSADELRDKLSNLGLRFGMTEEDIANVKINKEVLPNETS